MRERHDRLRKPSTVPIPSRGDLVHRYSKTKAPKLQFQWSRPTWLVVKTKNNRSLVRSLTSADGRRGKAPVEIWTNIKALKVAGPTPVNFWMGARVRREFRGSWHIGKVVSIDADQNNTLFKIMYDDCDQEDLDRGQIYDFVCYHPKLDTSSPSSKQDLHAGGKGRPVRHGTTTSSRGDPRTGE